MKTLITFILGFLCYLPISSAQTPTLMCFSNLDVSLDYLGQFELTPDMLLEGPAIFDSMWTSRTMLDCDDFGELDVILYASFNGAIQTCTTAVNIEDKLPPVPICDINTQLVLDANGQATLTPDQVDDGSYDNCGIVTLSLSQTQFDTTDGPIVEVTLTVTDASGNENMCYVNVHLLGSTSPSSIESNSSIYLTLPASASVIPTIESLLVYGPFYSWDVTYELFDNSNNIIPNNKITTAHSGETITFVVTEQNSGVSSGGYIYVSSNAPLNCNDFDICDILPWTSPAGGCASGHTHDDFIEWPGDLDISSCYYSPDFLANYSTINRRNAMPRLSGDCEFVDMVYEDVIFDFGNEQIKVLREWHVIEWTTFQRWNYTQILNVNLVNCATPVIVHTALEQGIENVNIYESELTDDQGHGVISENRFNSLTPTLVGTIKDGVDVHDALAVQEFINGSRSFSPLQMRLADVDKNSDVDVRDVLEIGKIANEIYDPNTPEPWLFFGSKSDPLITDIQPIVAGDYYGGPVDVIGGKRADVNGDASNFGQINSPLNHVPIELFATDKLLTEGEPYTIDFAIEDFEQIGGQQVSFEIDLNKIDIKNITSPSFPGFSEENYKMIGNNILQIFWLAGNDIIMGGGAAASRSTPILSIQIEALQNSILSTTMKLYGNQSNSIARIGDDSRYAFSLNWVGRIISNTSNVDYNLGTITISPNPADDQFTFLIDNAKQEELSLEIFNTVGKLMTTIELNMQAEIPTSTWESGMYIYKLTNKDGLTMGDVLLIQR